jgi:hypothetical protein
VTKFAAVVKRDSFGDGSYFADTLRFPLETYHPRIKADSLLVGLAGRFRPLPCTVQVGDTYALALLAENPGNETLSGIVASISMDIGYSSVESTARVVPSRDTVWILFSQPWVPLRPRVYWETGRLVWGSKEDSLVGQVQSLATGVEENPNRERDVEGEESSQSVMHSLSQTSIRLIQRGEYGLYNSLGQKVSIDHLKNGLGVWFLVPRTHKSGAPRKVVKI